MQRRQKLKSEKIRRTAAKKQKLMLERLQNHQAKRKGDAYGRGIALRAELFDEDNDAATVAAPTGIIRKTRVHATKCRCGTTDHVKINFGRCELNPKNIAKKQKNLLDASTTMNDVTWE